MKLLRILILGSMVAAGAPAQASDGDDDWKIFGGILSLVQSFVRIAASTDDPRAMQDGVDALLSGRNGEANRIAGDLMNEMFEDMPAQYRGTISALARDVMTIARRENAKAAMQGESIAPERLIQAPGYERALSARRDLTAMGLSYHETSQFLDAVRRDDALAVELFVYGRGVNVAAKGTDGRTAIDIARRNGNRQILALLGAPAATK